MKLEKGKKYDVSKLRCTGWIPSGAGDIGYNFVYYFKHDGEYLGAYEFSTEPEFDETIEVDG